MMTFNLLDDYKAESRISTRLPMEKDPSFFASIIDSTGKRAITSKARFLLSSKRTTKFGFFSLKNFSRSFFSPQIYSFPTETPNW